MKRMLMLVLACVAPTLGGCAWSNPDRRPVYEAFEDTMIPEDDGWFIATLPLTIPGGLLAIATDVIIAGPVIAADEAATEASEQWEDIDWKADYVSEVAVTPFRAATTATEFAFQWAWRSIFDVDEPVDPEEERALYEARIREAEERQRESEAEIRAIMEEVLRDPRAELPPLRPLPTFSWGDYWTPQLQAQFDERRLDLNPVRRMWFYRAAIFNHFGTDVKHRYGWTDDPDPVLRATLLSELHARGGGYGPATQLKNDEDPIVRALAREIIEASGG